RTIALSCRRPRQMAPTAVRPAAYRCCFARGRDDAWPSWATHPSKSLRAGVRRIASTVRRATPVTHHISDCLGHGEPAALPQRESCRSSVAAAARAVPGRYRDRHVSELGGRMGDELAALDATAQAELVRSGQVHPKELVEAA